MHRTMISQTQISNSSEYNDSITLEKNKEIDKDIIIIETDQTTSSGVSNN